MYRAEVEQSNNGGGDNGYPTKIRIMSDCSGNYFDVETNGGIVDLSIRGEWEALELGHVFVWIGNEINKIHAELVGKEVV